MQLVPFMCSAVSSRFKYGFLNFYLKPIGLKIFITIIECSALTDQRLALVKSFNRLFQYNGCWTVSQSLYLLRPLPGI